MNIVNLDLVLLGIGLLLMLWVWIYKSRPIASQVVLSISTVQAQYSWLVSWSLSKFSIFLLALDGMRQRPVGLGPFLPYVVYVLISSTIASFFWIIPAGVSFFYGDARIYVSLINFVVLALATMSLAASFAGSNGGRTLWHTLRWLAVVHGAFSAYQYVAITFGLPLIGISRAHGLTADAQIADIAIFVSDAGMEVLRPGGLAGEPKTAAVIFGLILLSIVYLGHQLDSKRHERLLTIFAALFSLFGFVAALSTSAFIGFGAALIWTIFLVKLRYQFRAGMRILLFLILVILALLPYLILSDFFLLLSERTIDRFGDAMDSPVEASLNAMMDSIPIALFGTGEGGSTFVIMQYLNSPFEYAYAPNIGIVRLVVENGLIGSFLFFVAYSVLVKKALIMLRSDRSGIRLLFFTTSISTMFLCMAGSGIPLGIPLAIAAVYAAQARTTDLESTRCVA